MKTQLIIWGKCKEELSTSWMAYSQGIKIGYQLIEGQLLGYRQIQECTELEEMIRKKEFPILCTDQLKDYIYLQELLKEKTSYTLIFIPHLQQIEIKSLCQQFIWMQKQMIRKISCEKQLTILWGKGENEGEMILNFLEHFHLIQQRLKYHFLCYLVGGINEIGLAQIEDVLREYISEKSSVHLTALQQTKVMGQEESFFCLLCSG